jgi:hypothetical protein
MTADAPRPPVAEGANTDLADACEAFDAAHPRHADRVRDWDKGYEQGWVKGYMTRPAPPVTAAERAALDTVDEYIKTAMHGMRPTEREKWGHVLQALDAVLALARRAIGGADGE